MSSILFGALTLRSPEAPVARFTTPVASSSRWPELACPDTVGRASNGTRQPTVLVVTPTGRWAGLVCMDEEHEILLLRRVYLRRAKTPAAKVFTLCRAVDRVLARYEPRIFVLEQGRPGLKSPALESLVPSLTRLAQFYGVPVIHLSRRCASTQLTGSTRWKGCLSMVHPYRSLIRLKLPDHTGQLLRNREKLREVRDLFAAITIARAVQLNTSMVRVMRDRSLVGPQEC